MTVPDFIISQTTLEEYRLRGERSTPDPDLPRPRHRCTQPPNGEETQRLRLVAAVRAIAARLEPRPAQGG